MENLQALAKEYKKNQWSALFEMFIEMGKTITSEQEKDEYYNTVLDWCDEDLYYSPPPIIFGFKLERVEYNIKKIQPKNKKMWEIFKDGVSKLTVYD